MKLLRHLVPLALSVLATGSLAHAQVGRGLLDPNVATEKQLAGLPGLTADHVKALVAKRPFADAVAFDEFLTAKGLGDEAREKLYGKAFVHMDLNRAEERTFQLIPGVGKRMAHEFEEYRPWKSKAQFEKEIGKYVDDDELARLERYVTLKVDQTVER